MATPATEGMEAAKEDNRKAKLKSSVDSATKKWVGNDPKRKAQVADDEKSFEHFSINGDKIDGVFSPNVKKLIQNELLWFKTDGFSKEDLQKYLSQMVDEVFNA